jgi:hypothetical protein|tara:strand:- start:186 stop:413 length:228 start_codon:yes stop_codon:yes gene_type:complete
MLPLLKKLGIYRYKQESTHIFVQAEDPDEACFIALAKLTQQMLEENNTAAVKDTIKDLRHMVRVVKLRRIGPRIS